MRLLDRILIDGVNLPQDLVSAWRKIEALLRKTEMIVIDNVLEYFCGQFDERARIQEKFTARDFPCVTPPFPNAFFDVRVPRSSPLHPYFEDQGMWIIHTTRQEAEQWVAENHPDRAVFLSRESALYLRCVPFLRERGSRKAVQVGGFLIPITKEGGMVLNADGGVPVMGDVYFSPDPTLKNLVAHFVFYPVLLALSFMHCKNVKATEEIPSPKLSKQHKRKYGAPLLRYHVLQIDHMKSVLDQEGHASETGLKRALHICRGHFSVYKDEDGKRLFGKHAGRFWMPMHIRGTPELGVVVKDYKVK